MNLSEEKKELQRSVQSILSLDYIGKEARTASALKELQEDMDNDFFTVVVLGEFKRGKSTFINAVLQTELLPVDVLPETATINALMYSEKPTVQVVMNDAFRFGFIYLIHPEYDFLFCACRKGQYGRSHR